MNGTSFKCVVAVLAVALLSGCQAGNRESTTKNQIVEENSGQNSSSNASAPFNNSATGKEAPVSEREETRAAGMEGGL
jgi:uncharacterized lipoprotein